MKLNIVNKSDNALPNYETVNSAGMDLRAYLPDGQIVIKSMQRILVPTGLLWRFLSVTKDKSDREADSRLKAE